jgi:hypothetical protein
MTITTPLPASQILALSPPTTFWRRTAAPEMHAPSCSKPTALQKIRAQLSQMASSPQVEAPDPGASARKRDRPALTAAFKSP